MRNKLIVIDAGHGMGNRHAGVFDPGAVRYQKSQVPSPRSQVEATEAEFTLRYALALDAALGARGFETRLTRFDHKIPCSLQDRLEVARKNFAALLVSLHLNAAPTDCFGAGLRARPGQAQGPAPTPGTGDSRRQPRGHEVLYRTAPSAEVAQVISRALARHIPAHGAGVVRRAGLYVLQYDPSVLIEVGFLDSDEDYALLADDLFKTAAMESVGEAIADSFKGSRLQVPSSKPEVSAARAGTWNLELGT